MQSYFHRQRAGRWLAIPATAALVLLLLSFLTSLNLLIWGVPFLALMMWIFGSLTIRVADGELRWGFGPGFPRFRVPVAEIDSAEVVPTGWGEGWGIHRTRYGTLYNIAGFQAVAVHLRNGRRFALGTDQPEQLLGALRSAGTAR